MMIRSILLFPLIVTSFFGFSQLAFSQVQIPTLQVCNGSGNSAYGSGIVQIDSRAPLIYSGSFDIKLDLRCNPNGSGFPIGSLSIGNINMNDSAILGDVEVSSFEQMTTTGSVTPTTYFNAQCQYKTQFPGTKPATCRIWVMIADNRTPNDIYGTHDIVSFLVFDATGNRIAYGTGPLVQGDLVVVGNGE